MDLLPDHQLPSFARRLKQLRRTKGWKQNVLAEALGVDQATISRWENQAQIPDFDRQLAALAALSDRPTQDQALKRLVENASNCVHLVEEATHICLAYSAPRARDWEVSSRSLLGVSLWQFATDEIRQAESELAHSDWWEVHSPKPRAFVTKEAKYDEIRISQGGILWERIYLADGTPARLVTGVSG